jgi:hypothetical protein
LPRHYAGDQQADHVLRRAEPGESTEKTELYNPFTLPSSSLIEWGIGVDLYFSSLRLMAMTLLVAGLLHLPNTLFYAGKDYSPNGKTGLAASLQGSAICTTQEWVVCTDCQEKHFDESRFLRVDEKISLVLRNMCDGGKLPQGFTNWFVLVFLGVIFALLAVYIRVREVRFDEDK